jgi:hypothetical protein
MSTTSALPPIENWWPRLGIPTRHWLVEHAAEPLPDHVLTEIVTLCRLDPFGEDEQIVLIDADRDYIVTQTESVD